MLSEYADNTEFLCKEFNNVNNTLLRNEFFSRLTSAILNAVDVGAGGIRAKLKHPPGSNVKGQGTVSDAASKASKQAAMRARKTRRNSAVVKT